MNTPKLRLGILPILAMILLLGSFSSLRAQSSGTTDDGYSWTSDGISVTITGGTPGMTNIIIPSTISGLPVSCIGYKAFFSSDYGMVTSIVIPDSVTCISAGAFYGCQKVSYLTIPDSVSSFGSSCFGTGVGCLNAYNQRTYGGNYIANYAYINGFGMVNAISIPGDILIKVEASNIMKKWLQDNALFIGIQYYVMGNGNMYGPTIAPLNLEKTAILSAVDYSNIATNPVFLNALTAAVSNSTNAYGLLQQGPPGPAGLNGATGPQGSVGATGPQGPIGLTGA